VSESLSFGKIAGVRVGANWSVLVVFSLIAWLLAGTRLPLLYPGFDEIAYWVTATVTTFIFFAALIAHELGHAVVARREGIHVEGITLFLFGGVAKFRGDNLGPSSELRIALAGPAVSVLLTGAFAAAAATSRAAGAPHLVVDMFSWLWRINLVVALFNLVPAFPLDGGRVLRALVWRFKGKVTATKVAAWAGRAFGYGSIGVGTMTFALEARPDGIWLALIGWFVAEAATRERAGVILKDALDGVAVGDVMAPDPPCAPAWMTLDELVGRWAHEHRTTTFPLVRLDGTAAGLLTLDAVKATSSSRRAEVRADTVARRIDDLPTATPDEPIITLLERMAGKPKPGALVLEGERIVGVVTAADIDRALELAALRGSDRRADLEGSYGRGETR
jgi:Zn-dependent protease